MRKIIKNQLFELIQTIYEAIEYCKKQPDINVLADCQNAAVIIGGKIEEIEGEGTIAVSYLEEFTDLIYNAGIVVDNLTEFRKALNKSRDKLRQAEHELKNKIITEYEILFLPYKASMWDALDSIYREAIKEANCHVTVMPSPYFNINPQRQILGTEYEGELFPKDIPITHYNDYNIAANHPDVIFIHNPYDDCNYVTQLPQEFFSSELVKHTDKLVYVPYFVNDGSDIRDHYCQVPSVRNSWRTFVHSDKVRDVYCKFNPSEKIVALGSPKFDMVVNYENNKPEIPEEWAKIFEGKKVFLYNTHLRNIIGHAEKMIDKLDYVFSVFEKRDDVALLWRPHPLSIQTAKSMSPYILEKYMALIERFKKLSNGVYDDTADIHRAIAISDAYIGDGSSVVSMYGITGKPMYIMGEPEIYTDDPFDYALTYSGVEFGEAMYAFSSEYNALYKIKNNIAEYVDCFDKEPVYKRDMFIKIFEYNNELIFIPFMSDYIVRYNIKSREIHYYKIDMDTAFGKCICPILYNDSIYMPMRPCDCIVKFDLKTNKLKYFKNIFCLKNKVNKFVFHNVTLVENYMFAPCVGESKLLMWDMSKDIGTVADIPQITNGCIDIAINESDIYLLAYPSKDIWKWNRKTNEITCILQNTGAQRIHLYKDKLFIIPGTGDEICILNLDTLDNKKLECPEGFRFLNTYKKAWSKYLNYEITDNIMKLYPRNANMYLEINMDNYKMSGSQWQLSEIVKTQEFKNARRLNFDYTYWDGRYGMDEFISVVDSDVYKEQRKDYLCRHIINDDGSAGKEIWEYICKNE